MTFSLAALSPDGLEVGVAIASSSMAVASRCAFVQAGVGAVLSQNVTDPRLGPAILQRMAAGSSAEAALADVLAHAEHAGHRQLAAVDRDGTVAHYSGHQTLGAYSHATAARVVAVGNLLASLDVPARMIQRYRATPESQPLSERLLAGLHAGLDAGGEAGPVHSAGLLVAHAGVDWPWVNLRVDWSDAPIRDLRQLWERWRPEAEHYVLRALDPERAPPFQAAGETQQTSK